MDISKSIYGSAYSNYGSPWLILDLQSNFMDIHELLWISIILIMEIHDYEFGFQ